MKNAHLDSRSEQPNFGTKLEAGLGTPCSMLNEEPHAKSSMNLAYSKYSMLNKSPLALSYNIRPRGLDFFLVPFQRPADNSEHPRNPNRATHPFCVHMENPIQTKQ